MRCSDFDTFPLRFMKKQNENVLGLSTLARVLRKRRNLVSTRFNMMNWLLETLSLSLMIIETRRNMFTHIFYHLVNSFGTPMVFLESTFVIILIILFSWSTFLALRKTEGLLESSSSHAWGYSREKRLPSPIKNKETCRLSKNAYLMGSNDKMYRTKKEKMYWRWWSE